MFDISAEFRGTEPHSAHRKNALTNLREIELRLVPS